MDVYLLEEFIENEPIMTKIDEVRRKLEGSTRQNKLKVLLNDIAKIVIGCR